MMMDGLTNPKLIETRLLGVKKNLKKIKKMNKFLEHDRDKNY
jgi:hypothetical protein